jgi:hypothetical protein
MTMVAELFRDEREWAAYLEFADVCSPFARGRWAAFLVLHRGFPAWPKAAALSMVRGTGAKRQKSAPIGWAPCCAFPLVAVSPLNDGKSKRNKQQIELPNGLFLSKLPHWCGP